MRQKKYNFKGVIDTTFRDGQQSPLLFDTYKYRFSLNDKRLLLDGLLKLGVSHIEFFSPVVSRAEARDFRKLKEYIKSKSTQETMLITHCRCNTDDIEKAIDAGFTGVNLYMGISKRAQNGSYKKSFSDIFSLIKSTLSTVRKKYPDLYIRFSTEDAFRTPLSDIFNVYDEIYQYVDTFGIPDTVGVATPDMVTHTVSELKKRYPEANLECHFHNDRGFSLVNALYAIQAGAEFIDTSIWGLAERSGITSVTGLLLNLHQMDQALTRKYNIDVCYPLNMLMGTVLEMQVPYSEPVSLTNRTHTAGVHQKAVLNDATLYEAHRLDRFGVLDNNILLGPLSGWNLIYYYVREIKGYDVSADDAKKLTAEYKRQVNKINRKKLPEKLLMGIVKQHKYRKIEGTDRQQFIKVENLN